MLTVSNLSLQFGSRVLFDNVNIKFTKGNCYGIIGANGSGKSTFLKIISGEQEATKGKINIENNKRISSLKQDHNIFNKYTVLQCVIMGNDKLFKIKNDIENLYKKINFSDKDGIKASELSIIYEEMGGWNSENDAKILLSNLGVKEFYYNKFMSEINSKIKVRILIAQALFDNPDILILDEPTNNLDVNTTSWLEEFLSKYKNTVIVVSHDRHFLDTICTHICDLDFGSLNIFTGNYSNWYNISQIISNQKLKDNKKTEEKRKELQSFIQKFSSNVSKAKQATSRKKILEKLNINNIKSSRKYPSIVFEKNREIGNQILEINNISKYLGDEILIKKLSITLKKGDKVAIISNDKRSSSLFYDILINKIIPDNGYFNWGPTIEKSYIPIDNSEYFKKEENIIEWLKKYSVTQEDREEEYIRNLLGRMLFSGNQTSKSVSVLSGGEKMRCMFSKMMLSKGNVLLFNEPTNNLDLESIISLNNAIKTFDGIILITSKDYELIQSTCNRILEITPKGFIDRYMNYDDYINHSKINEIRNIHYS